MAQAMRSTGEMRADYGYMRALARQRDGVDRARAIMAEKVADRERRMRIVIDGPMRIVDGFDAVAGAGNLGDVDLDAVIDRLRSWETDLRSDRRALRNVVAAAEREARRINPAVVPVLRDAERQFADLDARVAEACREARWRLMALRAEHQPSNPEGEIVGEATDLDEYLRMLG